MAARQAAACPELAALGAHTGDRRLVQGAVEIARRVADYQEPEGCWHQWYHRDGTPGRRFQHFGDSRYLSAAHRVTAWAFALWDRHGYIPALTDVWPYDQAEASFPYFYGLQALALLEELDG